MKLFWKIISVLIIFLFVFLVILGMVNTNSKNFKICRDNGFEYYSQSREAKEGYVACCNSTYINNMLTNEPYCQGVKVEVK
jgi:hypothetical protein